VAIGTGVVLLVIGLVLVLDVVDLPAEVDDVIATNALGWILIAGGVIALVLSLIINAQRARTTHVEERRTDTP
jgi:tetrahydromethanopterin S-methyltransferase subunit E